MHQDSHGKEQERARMSDLHLRGMAGYSINGLLSGDPHGLHPSHHSADPSAGIPNAFSPKYIGK